MDDPTSAPSPDRQRAWQHAARRFDHYVGERPIAARSLLAALVAIHLLVGFSERGRVSLWGRVFGMRPEAVMIRFGARDGTGVAHGEWWRLLTHGFLHWDVSHLFMNGLALWGLGRLCEIVYGRVRFLWLFLVSVVGGGLLSQTGASTVVSAGASGGLFGLLGALAVYGWRRGDLMPPPLRDMFGKRLTPWILVNIGIGIVLPFVDNRAHIGGLLAGSACGLVLGDRLTDNGQGSARMTWVLGALVTLTLVGTAIAMGVSAFG